MSKSLTDDKMQLAVGFVKKNVEPRIARMLEEVNKLLAKEGIMAGLELQWMFDKTPAAKKEDA